ncbi:MAG: hypothetical protein KDC52_11550 [Ignavibacteriae bacterium]|nr:hypothetical protein [Ignavibacteriota bacterium]MCB0748874.1 hypothetical protein [Ignavibacteriota bacterium]MCB0752101.1 hypothetical protein [Ignavibacteriota bacterium]MCB9249181.1 hypothetical protein [Ignavibacteriales bacterium]
MKKYLPALVAGFAAGVLHIVPIAKAFTCCLVVPGAAFIAITLAAKSEKIIGEFDLKRGAILGVLTGVFAALFGSFFDIFITFVTKNNDLLNSFNQLSTMLEAFPVPQEVKQEVISLIQNVADSIKTNGFSLLYSLSVILNNLIVDIIFGLIGGLVGTKIFNSKNSGK